MKDLQLVWLLFAITLLLHFCICYLYIFWDQPAEQRSRSAPPKLRILKPKTDKDCPCCKAQVAGGHNPETVCTEHVIPWSMRKGPGGKKKTISTQGYFCSNPLCYYYLLDDENIHALVC